MNEIRATLEDLKKSYPGCHNVVAVHERSVSQLAWAMARANAERYGVEETVRIMTEEADKAASLFPDIAIARWVGEMRHPDFLRYVRAKLGSM